LGAGNQGGLTVAVNVQTAYRRFFQRPEGLMIAALSAAAITLIAAAVIGGRHAGGTTAGVGLTPTTVNTPTTTAGPTVNGKKTGPLTTTGPNVVVPGTKGPSGPITVGGGGQRVSQVGATREGVFKDHFEVGIHGPITFSGVPLGLADDPVTGVKGYVTYLNRRGGINGLKIKLYIVDDRYESAGGRSAGDKLAKEIKPFIIEGTLGIDQIHAVALAAHGQGIPYMAGGGPEPELKDIGMYEIYTSYDADMKMLADYICKYGKSYVGATEVRLATTTLNSDYILPVEKRFVQDLSARHCVVTPVDPNARGTVDKPQNQSSYQDELQKFKTSYGGKGANLLVPLQDPVTTSRQVAELNRDPTYMPKWTFANFAHDGDTELALFQGRWTGTRGLSPGCYYHPSGDPNAYNATLCAKMGEAHREFVSLGNVTYDDNAGGSSGNSKSSYDYNEDNWKMDGSGAAFGYQIVYAWVGGMSAIGIDPTREKFLGAMNAYDSYSNLITGPITFKGSANHMIGADKFVVLEGRGPNGTGKQSASGFQYRQVVEITPGLVDHF
jgi:ABC-type branched-subunit amino acid transport system substrate-binding protein